ncbi:unnamed protein product [Didymodactylos carnosus]|uniref:Uncharacterized protein n=1 Tax=Didymodactylos carnosus TaxID=1234261 RepID=A0A816FQY2_9BILA|nr:unnamed protein product [Didymodactylos carnosus]CAF4620398.1 unnamed protein product [Didymodactylos carnosus]
MRTAIVQHFRQEPTDNTMAHPDHTLTSIGQVQCRRPPAGARCTCAVPSSAGPVCPTIATQRRPLALSDCGGGTGNLPPPTGRWGVGDLAGVAPAWATPRPLLQLFRLARSCPRQCLSPRPA